MAARARLHANYTACMTEQSRNASRYILNYAHQQRILAAGNDADDGNKVMKVVITGGTGFLGQQIAKAIIAQNGLMDAAGTLSELTSLCLFDMAVPDSPIDGLNDPRISYVGGDITDAAQVDALIDCDDVVIFHLASIVSAGGEADFDLAMRVNLGGMQNILEAARRCGTAPRVIFASSLAVFGGDNMPSVVSDSTKQTSQITYGITKTIGELLINDYSRKGYIDGRSARLANIIIRPGKPNAAASAFCSGVFREPLNGDAIQVPVDEETLLPVQGYRSCVDGFMALAQMDSAALGDDRAVFLPNRSYRVSEMIAALRRVAAANALPLGEITFAKDHHIAGIIAAWPQSIDAARGLTLGLPDDAPLDDIIQHYIDDFMPAG